MLTIKELQTELQTLTNLKITQTDMAKALNTTRANISMRAKNESKATLSEVKKIVEYLHIPGSHNVLNAILAKENRLIEHEINNIELPNCANDYVLVDYYPDVFGSCGGGAFVFSEHKEVMEVPRKCFKSFSGVKTYSVINAIGDSMYPFIMDKDRLIVEHYNGEQIKDNRVYVFRFYDNIFIKRLILNLDQVVVKSDNTQYHVRYIERNETENLQIIGQIVGIMRDV